MEGRKRNFFFYLFLFFNNSRKFSIATHISNWETKQVLLRIYQNTVQKVRAVYFGMGSNKVYHIIEVLFLSLLLLSFIV